MQQCLGRLFAGVFIAGTALALSSRAAEETDNLKVGIQPDGSIVVPTNQVLTPAGTQITFPGRPVDLALTEGGKVLVVKNMKSLEFIDLEMGKVKQTLPTPGLGNSRPGFSVVGLVVLGDRVYS